MRDGALLRAEDLDLEREVVLARHYREPPESYDSIGTRLRVSKNRARDAGDIALVKLSKYFAKE